MEGPFQSRSFAIRQHTHLQRQLFHWRVGHLGTPAHAFLPVLDLLLVAFYLLYPIPRLHYHFCFLGRPWPAWFAITLRFPLVFFPGDVQQAFNLIALEYVPDRLRQLLLVAPHRPSLA